ncbi:MAG: global cell cycle regulator GcrA-like protein [Alphaproteobacteria bacterium]|nr:global cell cycle regulator GcrA-like protein [Alphaproteobacteria bacterium]MBR1757058.1 global cell cycle regulator GcrA-like protein [Alphaproteobacteria bacterium]
MGWTEESVEQLRQMWAQGLTANEIAKKLGVTKNAIVGKVHRLCLTARPSPIKSKENETATEDIFALETTEENAVAAISPQEKKPKKSEVKNEKKSENIRLVDLDSHTCRWPIGDPRDDDFSFCGKKVRMGQTYCDEHAQLAYVKALKK